MGGSALRLLVLGALLAPFLVPGAGAGATPSLVLYHILDPAQDVGVDPEFVAVRVPDPSIDLRVVTIAQEGADLVITFQVEDLDYKASSGERSERRFYVTFDSTLHDWVSIQTYEEMDATWSASIACFTGWDFSCYESLAPPVIDPVANTYTIRAPLSVIQGEVIDPSATGAKAFGDYRRELYGSIYRVEDNAPSRGVSVSLAPLS